MNQRLVLLTNQTSTQLTFLDPIDNSTYTLRRVANHSTSDPFRYQFNGSAYVVR